MKYILLTACLALTTSTAFCQVKAPAAPAQPAAADQPSGFSGKVVETTNAATYTYVCVDTGSKKVWAAAPQFAVKVGDSVSIPAGMPMPNYHSKTMNRDFEVVYFTDKVVVNGKKSGAEAGVTELPKGHPPISGAAAKPVVDLSGIKKATGGKTVAEIYAEHKKLQGKEVRIRGKVVKYNPMIMGKNWIHLRDGSGAEGSNDLLVTSLTPVKIGDTVLVTGTVSLNRDFGGNYKYDVMVEDAKVVVE